jgi:hypothetical protein
LEFAERQGVEVGGVVVDIVLLSGWKAIGMALPDLGSLKDGAKGEYTGL